MLLANNQQTVIVEALLEKGGSVSIHNCNLRILPTEMYEIKNDLSPLIVTEFLKKRNEQLYDIRSNARFTILPIRKVYHDSFLGPKIWDILPYILKNSNRIETFKMKTKKWKPQNCQCHLLKVYVQNVGFVGESFIERKERKISYDTTFIMRFREIFILWYYDFIYVFLFKLLISFFQRFEVTPISIWIYNSFLVDGYFINCNSTINKE